MIRRTFALTMVVLLLAVFGLQGAGIMRCASSGEIYLAGWQEVKCAMGLKSEAGQSCCCCEVEDELVLAESEMNCCWLLGTVPEFEFLAGANFVIPSIPVSDFVPELVTPISECDKRTVLAVRFEEPDPPGVSLRVRYSTFLI